MAAGCTFRITDTGWPRKRPVKKADKDAAQTADGTDTVGSAEVVAEPKAAEPAPKMTIVLLHGYLESLEVWDDFTDMLKPYMRVVSLDLPGHGISEVCGEVHTMEFLAEAVHGALEQIGVERCVVCGHSMGGYVALEMLRQYPQIFAGLILLHSVTFADTDEKRETRKREIGVIEAGKKDLLATTTDKAFAPANRKRLAPAIQDLSDQAFLTDDKGVIALLKGMGLRRDQNDTLAASAVPQLFVHGRCDEFIAPEVAEEMIARNPQAQVVWLENSGHIGFIEEPQASADAVLGFCRSLDWA